MKLEGKYEGGAREGDWKYYEEDGSLAVTIKYRNGEKVRIDGTKVPVDFDEP